MGTNTKIYPLSSEMQTHLANFLILALRFGALALLALAIHVRVPAFGISIASPYWWVLAAMLVCELVVWYDRRDDPVGHYLLYLIFGWLDRSESLFIGGLVGIIIAIVSLVVFAFVADIIGPTNIADIVWLLMAPIIAFAAWCLSIAGLIISISLYENIRYGRGIDYDEE